MKEIAFATWVNPQIERVWAASLRQNRSSWKTGPLPETATSSADLTSSICKLADPATGLENGKRLYFLSNDVNNRRVTTVER